MRFGVIPGWDIMGGTKQTPEDVREMVSYIMANRHSSEPFEVAFGGKTSGTDIAADAHEVIAYRDAGVTFWLEDLNPWRGPLAEMRERIRRGPVKVDD